MVLVQEWPQLVGEPVAAESSPSRLRAGVLSIQVRSPVWAQEMQLSTRELLKKIQAAAPALNIKKIRFYCA